MGRESAKYVLGDKLPCVCPSVFFARGKKARLGPKKSVYGYAILERINSEKSIVVFYKCNIMTGVINECRTNCQISIYHILLQKKSGNVVAVSVQNIQE